MKDFLCAAFGAIVAVVTAAFGGWSAGMTTLVALMAADYATGLLVAGVFHASEKTQHGGLESRAGWKGLVRKCVTLLMVFVACRLDILLGVNYVRDAVVIAFCANEVLSIVENAALMGVPIPAPLSKAIELLRAKAEQEAPDKDVDYKSGYKIVLDELSAARAEIERLKKEETERTKEESSNDGKSAEK